MQVPYRRLASIALVVIALSYALIAVIVTHDDKLEDLVFLGVFGGVALAIAALAYRLDRWWPSALALIAGVLALAMGLSYHQNVFTRIDRVWEFAPTILSLAGAAAAALFGAADLLQRRRGRPLDAPEPVAAAFAAALAVVAALITVSIGVTAASTDTVTASERSGAQTIVIEDYDYEPSDVTVHTGETVRFVVDNNDFATHTFSVTGTDIDEEVSGGDERLLTFTAPPAGTYEIHCTIEYHDDMKATLIVE